MPQNKISPEDLIDLYARAATNLYGIISFEGFLGILSAYSKHLDEKKVIHYFRNRKSSGIGYYFVVDDLLIHGSINTTGNMDYVLSVIQDGASKTKGQRRVLPEKELLKYADPTFFEETPAVKETEEFLTGEVGLSKEDANDVLLEMIFICRSDAIPTILMDALTRRGIKEDYKAELITYGSMISNEARHWEHLGFTYKEVESL